MAYKDGAGGPERLVATAIPNNDRTRIKTLDDLALTGITINEFPVVKEWRRRLFDSDYLPEICDELPTLLTEYMQSSDKTGGLCAQRRRAMALKHVFENKRPIVQLPIDGKDALLPGQTTTSFVGPVVYADTIGYCIWPELKTVAKRPQNPFTIKPEVARNLNRTIFPYWMDRRTVQEVARYSAYDTEDYKDEDRVRGDVPSIDPPLKKKAGETPKCQEIFERVAFFLSDKATCVSHTVPDFDRMLKYGLEALAGQMRRDIDDGTANTPEQVEFLEGVIMVFEGALAYANGLAEAAEDVGNDELARICRKVPAKPAETLREAVTAIWICYHLLLQENTNFGFSIGRLDQLLNDYYIRDWEKLGTEEEKDACVRGAVELICHFFLRCSDHVPLSTEGSEKLFAGSGSNQALTVGGAGYENGGKLVDAVNDMTYIILKATEMLSIRDPNVHARYHKDVHNRDANGKTLPPGRVSPYLRRLCQVNMVTRATPAIHGDAPVAASMAQYYKAHEGIDHDEAMRDAHEYASIGCIEQNSAGKHYGNTGSTLLVLPAVLELAIFGGKHRSDGVGEEAPNLFYGKAEYTTKPLWKMSSMDEFIEAFEFQMNEMARITAQNNNYFGRTTERVRPVPFLSGLFTGPTNIPDGKGASFRDLAAGGAKYNSSGVAVIGLADVIDAFCVIEYLVFGKKISVGELLAAMRENFSTQSLPRDGDGDLWKRLAITVKGILETEMDAEKVSLTKERMNEIIKEIKRAPKYGAGVERTGIYDNSTALDYTNLITRIVQKAYYQYRTHRGGRYLPGYWSMTNHAGFGMLSKATPNGRKKGAPFASGITPCPGLVKRDGSPVVALDHILSVAHVDANTVKNGYTYNLSLTTGGQENFDADTNRFARYMKSFEEEDGVLVQLCVTSIETFKEAHKAATAAGSPGAGEAERKDLDKYRDLMIRVAGYSAYFVTLSPEMREEIIARSNFALATGNEQHKMTDFS